MSDDILSKSEPPADVRVSYGSDSNQFLDLRFPRDRKPPHALLINIHGGFWRAKYDLRHAGHLCAALTSRGIATANVEYRRVGNVGGGWPGTFADIRSAYQFLLQNANKHHLGPSHFMVMGHSAGAQLALCLAAHETRLVGAVSLGGVLDLQRAYELHLSNDAVVEFLGGTPTEVPDHYRDASPMQLSISHGQQWIVHGSSDDTVPPAFSRDYVATKQKRTGHEKEDVHLLEIPDADHFDLIDPRSSAWKTVEEAALRSVR
jgi:acetyl esterase/lipase